MMTCIRDADGTALAATGQTIVSQDRSGAAWHGPCAPAASLSASDTAEPRPRTTTPEVPHVWISTAHANHQSA